MGFFGGGSGSGGVFFLVYLDIFIVPTRGLCSQVYQGPLSLGDKRALMSPGCTGAASTTRGRGGSRSSPMGWGPKAVSGLGFGKMS